MDLQTQGNQQIQLRNLQAKNEQLYKRRADIIIKKLENISSQSGEVYLDNLHLNSAIQYMKNIVIKKQNILEYNYHEQQIDKELQNQAIKQNQYLISQINRLNLDIQKINTKKQQYIQVQLLTSKQILQLDQIITQNLFNSSNRTSFNSQLFKIDTTDHFAYHISSDGIIRFNQSYIHLVQHNFKRIQQNEAIIQKLQNIYKENIKKTQTIKLKIQKLKYKNRDLTETISKVQNLQQKNNNLRQLLRAQARKTENQIEKRLVFQIDKNNKDISNKKMAYQKAYHTMLDLIKTVIDNANLETVTDYIKQS